MAYGAPMNARNDRIAVVFLYEGCTIAEVIEAATRLENNGVPVTWAGEVAGQLRDQPGLEISAAVSIAEIDPANVAVLLVPGGRTIRLGRWQVGAPEHGVHRLIADTLELDLVAVAKMKIATG